LSDRTVYVYRGEVLETSYPVAIGRPGWETPTGEFEVFSQVVEPGWTNPITGETMAPGAENPLGDRWIAFWTDGTNDIGFHGTPDRDSVGKAASHGCIRMYDEDVRELFDMVALGTPVIVEL
jgi:lipoprotein-anchoring transpeptidase ErfK/SrfK